MADLTRRNALRGFVGALAAVGTGAVAAACGESAEPRQASGTAAPAVAGAAPTAELAGTILIDGSSTVGPISQAIAEEFQASNRGVRVPVGTSGTGGGFKKFCIGETDISDASRPIKASEVETCQARGIGFIELPVAFDGLAVLTNPQNSFVDCLTVAELRTIWEPAAEETVTTWSQVRDGFPDEPLILYGPGVDSGTYDYFTEAIVGEEGASRGDFTPSEDDNVLVRGIAGDAGALGFFGLAYYTANADILRLVKIDGGDGCIEPTPASVNDGTYQPLSRPIFVYVSTAAADRPEVREFVRFYLQNAATLVADVGFVPLPDDVYALALDRFERRVRGSVFAGGGSQVGITLEDLLRE